jgi:hypothetical protein
VRKAIDGICKEYELKIDIGDHKGNLYPSELGMCDNPNVVTDRESLIQFL